MEKTNAAAQAENKPDPTNIDQNTMIDGIIENIKGNKFTVYFYAPAMNFQSGGVMVLFRLAKRMKDAGYNVKVVYEPRLDQKFSYEQSVKENKQAEYFEVFAPNWMEFNVDDIERVPLGDKEITFVNKEKIKCTPLTVNPEDFLIIPEGFGTIMQKTSGIACKRIVLAQSYYYILSNLQPGQNWSHFGVADAISISDGITEFLKATMPMIRVKSLKQSINRDIFKPKKKMSDKFPMVAFTSGRGAESAMKVQNIIKLFYALHPHLRFVRFLQLGNMNREEFAEALGSCCLLLHTDEIAGFGTLPLEAMASGTHVVGFSSFCMNEYATETNGFWTPNGDIFSAVEMLASALDKWLLGKLDTDEVQKSYDLTLSKYTDEVEKTGLLSIMEEYKNERIAELSTLKIPVAPPAQVPSQEAVPAIN